VKSFSDLYKQTQALLLSSVFFVFGLQWVAQCHKKYTCSRKIYAKIKWEHWKFHPAI